MVGQFGKQRGQARQAYCEFVMAGKGVPSPLMATKHLLTLGDDDFVAQHHDVNVKAQEELRELSKAHRRSLALPLHEYEKHAGSRGEAMAQVYQSGAYTMAQIAAHLACIT